MIFLEERRERDAFAERAAKHFKDSPHHTTYTDGDIEADALFALRWGLGEDCVVVFKIGEEEAANYQQLISSI